MSMPSPIEYREAIEHPDLFFRDPDLRNARPKLTPHGLPESSTGNFAVVFKLESESGSWAVRCFHKTIPPDLQERYSAISKYLTKHQTRTEALLRFEFLADAIVARGRPVPIVKMQWVDAVRLDDAVQHSLGNEAEIDKLGNWWLKLDRELRELRIAHGDLQHGNVLVTGNGLKLVDYDGMFVPTLRGRSATEAGHPNFQSPRRMDLPFDQDLDRFSSVAIYTALRALRSSPELWKKHRMPADALLFRKEDFLKAYDSQLIQDLLASPDPLVSKLTKRICDASASLDPLPSLDSLVHEYPSASISRPGAPSARSWWRRTETIVDGSENVGQERSNQSVLGRVKSFFGLSPSVDESSSASGLAPSESVDGMGPTARSSLEPPADHMNSKRGWWLNSSNPPVSRLIGSDSSTTGTTGNWGSRAPDGAKGSFQQNTQQTGRLVSSSLGVRSPNPHPRPTLPPSLTNQPAAIPPKPRLRIVASPSSHIFHLPDCEYGSRVWEGHARWFASPIEAKNAGFRACKICKPDQLRVGLAETPPDSSHKPIKARQQSRNPQGRSAVRGPERYQQPPKNTSRISVGTIVTVKFDDGAIERFELVSASNRKAGSNQVSTDAPIAQALIGKSEGQHIIYQGSPGLIGCTVLKIE